MSGPKCYAYTLELQQRQREEAEQRRLAALKHAQQQARQAENRYRLLANAVEALKLRFPQERIAVDLPPQPAEAAADNQNELERYHAELTRIVANAEQQLQAETRRATANAAFRDALAAIGTTQTAPPRTAAELLAALARQAQAGAETDTQTHISARQRQAERLMQHLTKLELDSTPADLQTLLDEFIQTPGETRAAALETELKLRLQHLHEAKTQQETAVPDDPSRQQQAAQILEDALHDLGYAVEPIADTLFADGGTLHFQRSEWGDYYVRLRVYPEQGQINLNMVRTETAAGTPPPVRTDSLSVGAPLGLGQASARPDAKEDARMENAWCSEDGFPKLARVLASRGLKLDRVRAVPAGELPVQVVKPEAIDAELRQRKPAAATPIANVHTKPLDRS